MKISIRPALLLQKDGKILTMQYTYGGQKLYNLPGGNVEFGESLIEVLQREMEEELQIQVEIEEMQFIGETIRDTKQTIHTVFTGQITQGEPTLNPAETSAERIVWLSLEELLSVHMYPSVAQFIQKRLQGDLTDAYIGVIQQKWL
ncbi:MAG: NUDIX domain-containing protein [Spirosomataceae bacterium]